MRSRRERDPNRPRPPPNDFGGAGDAIRTLGNMNPPEPPPEALDAPNELVGFANDPVYRLLGVIPHPSAQDISPEWNDRLWKEILYTPAGSENDLGARKGMEVQVHYKGYLTDGWDFDKNQPPDYPFKFTLGASQVIQAWEIGVVGMKRGQIIKLISHPEFGYGDRESGKIPANSTLIFEIEMVDFTPEDLTKKKNGCILRYNVKEGGSKYINPNHGSLVEVLIRGHCGDMMIYPETTITFPLGEGCEYGIPYGVEKALYKFRSQEGSTLLIKGVKYGITPEDYVKYGISPNSTLEFYVELLSHQNSKEPWQLDGPEKLEIAKSLKESGNKFFAKSNYKIAYKNYKLIVDHLKAEALLTGDLEEERKKLLLAAYLNMAICNLKLIKPTMVIRNCDDALDLDAKNTKALFRRGLANLTVNLPDAAKKDFEKVLELEPNNVAVPHQLVVCERQIQINLKQEKGSNLPQTMTSESTSTKSTEGETKEKNKS